MASKSLSVTLTVKTVFPGRVTVKMIFGAVMAWLSGNCRWLLKCDWPIEIVEAE